MKLEVCDILGEGAENALPGKRICDLLGITQRELADAIQRERRNGRPICASSGRNPGYYLAANQAEMERYCRSLQKRAGEIHKTRRRLLKTLPDLPGESTLES